MKRMMMRMIQGDVRASRRSLSWAAVAVIALVAVPACQPYHIAKSELERMAAEAEAKMMAELELERKEEATRAEEAAKAAETQRIATAQRAAEAARAAETERAAAAQRAAEQRAAEQRAIEQRRQQEQAARQPAASSAANGGRASAGAAAAHSAGGVQDGGSVQTGTSGGTWSKARFVQGDKPVQYQVQMLGTNPDGSAKALFRFFVNKQDAINNCAPIADCLGYYLELKYDWNDPAMEYNNIEFYWFDKNTDAVLTIGPVSIPMGGDANARSTYDPQEGFQVSYANGAVEHRMPFSACADHKLASYSGHRCLRFEKQIPAVLVR